MLVAIIFAALTANAQYYENPYQNPYQPREAEPIKIRPGNPYGFGHQDGMTIEQGNQRMNCHPHPYRDGEVVCD